MWYEILPSFGIIYGLLVAPCACNIFYKMQFMRNGKGYSIFAKRCVCIIVLRNTIPTQPRNWLTNKWDHMTYKRDLYITGSEYIPRGLESIPDEEK